MTDVPYPDNFIINVPEPYLIAIGKVSVVWGLLESVVDLALAKLGGYELSDPRSAIVTAHMTWPLKMDVLESFVTALRNDHPHLSRFDNVKPLLKRAAEGRNKIVHGQWVYEDGIVRKLRATARGKLRSSMDPVTLDQIAVILDDIGRAGAATFKLIVNK